MFSNVFDRVGSKIWSKTEILGKTESPNATHEDTLRIVQITDEARRQLGVVFPHDNGGA